MQPVYSAGRQLLKVQLLMWASVIVFAVCAWQAVDTFQTYGLREADGGRLAAPAARAAWAAVWFALGLAAPIGMWVYGRRYIAAIRVGEDQPVVELDTLGFFGTRTMQVPASSVHFGRWHAGYLRTARATVKAPWTALRVDGLRRTLILDDQGIILDGEFPKRLREAARDAVRS